MNLVSIIVPCYNQAQYLDECLESVLNQTYSNWECIIVNDGSTDKTGALAENWCIKDKRFQYFEKENGGVASARNYGVSKSNGEFILPLDADDYIGENYIEICEHEMNTNSKLKLVYGDPFKFGEVNEKWNLPEYSFENLLQFNMIFCTAMYRRSDFDRIGGYDENMKHSAEDWDFWICLLKDGGDVLKTTKCLFYYRIKEESRNSNLSHDNVKVNTSSNYIFNKHRDCYGSENSIELYIKYLDLKSKLNNLDGYLSFKATVSILMKKIKRKVGISS